MLSVSISEIKMNCWFQWRIQTSSERGAIGHHHHHHHHHHVACPEADVAVPMSLLHADKR